MNKKIEVNISNKLLYSFLALVIVIILGIGVYAYGGTAPATMGHTMGELMPSCNGWLRGTSNDPNSWSCTPSPPSCTGTNQALHWSGSAWSCVTIDTGTDSCSWTGWYPVCRCFGTEDAPCSYNVYPILMHQEYCVGGTITQERDIYCCPTDANGLCMAV